MKKRILWSAVPVLSALPAVLIGSLVMRLHGVSTSAYLQNLAALLIPGAGFGVYLSVARPAKPKARHGYAAMLACLAALGCTFLDSGTDGIHRWIQVGSFALHAAFLFMPLALTGMDILFMAGKPHAAYVCALLTGVALFLQPDASMSGALVMAMVPMLWHDRKNSVLYGTVLFVLLMLAAVSWLRPESPAPVLQVEGILELAQASGWQIASLLSLMILFCPFAAGLCRTSSRLVSAANLLFYAALLAAACTGTFPVPVLGSGASPIIGYLMAATYVIRRLKAGESGPL